MQIIKLQLCVLVWVLFSLSLSCHQAIKNDSNEKATKLTRRASNDKKKNTKKKNKSTKSTPPRMIIGSVFNPQIAAVVDAVSEAKDIAVISVGKDQKVSVGHVFYVIRGGTKIAKLKVTDVYQDLSGAKIIETYKQHEVMVGDVLRSARDLDRFTVLDGYHKDIQRVFGPKGQKKLPELRGYSLLGPNDQKYPEYEHDSTGLIFVLLPGGKFMMGSPEDEPGRNDDELLHKVKVSPFLMAKYEVSQEIWEKFMGSNPSNFKGQNLPVETISWKDCYGDSSSFCRKLWFGLPTEAQWEYACRSGTVTPFSFDSGITLEQENFRSEVDSENRNKTVEVDQGEPNRFGLYNMHGNVSEWCLDVYNEHYYSTPEATNGDVPAKSDGGFRVIRGGCWYLVAPGCRSAARESFGSSKRHEGLGFRPVVCLPK